MSSPEDQLCDDLLKSLDDCIDDEKKRMAVHEALNPGIDSLYRTAEQMEQLRLDAAAATTTPAHQTGIPSYAESRRPGPLQTRPPPGGEGSASGSSLVPSSPLRRAGTSTHPHGTARTTFNFNGSIAEGTRSLGRSFGRGQSRMPIPWANDLPAHAPSPIHPRPDHYTTYDPNLPSLDPSPVSQPLAGDVPAPTGSDEPGTPGSFHKFSEEPSDSTTQTSSSLYQEPSLTSFLQKDQSSGKEHVKDSPDQAKIRSVDSPPMIRARQHQFISSVEDVLRPIFTESDRPPKRKEKHQDPAVGDRPTSSGSEKPAKKRGKSVGSSPSGAQQSQARSSAQRLRVRQPQARSSGQSSGQSSGRSQAESSGNKGKRRLQQKSLKSTNKRGKGKKKRKRSRRDYWNCKGPGWSARPQGREEMWRRLYLHLPRRPKAMIHISTKQLRTGFWTRNVSSSNNSIWRWETVSRTPKAICQTRKTFPV
ncbi:hypothetical protein IWZ01DRAFT_486094 [Phyllosticta capitalensis]